MKGRSEPLSADHPLLWLSLLGALGGIFVVLSAVYAPLVPVLGCVALVGGFVLLKTPQFMTFLVAIGIMLDDVNVNAGFALLGMGDFAVALIYLQWTLSRLKSGAPPLRLPPAWPLMIAYLTFTLISWVMGARPAGTGGMMVRLLVYVGAVLMLVDYLKSLKALHVTFLSMILSGVIHASLALYLDNDNARLGGLADQANTLGSLLGLTLSVALAYFKHYATTPTQRALLLSAIFVTLLGLIFTISRGSYLAFGLTMLWLYQRYLRYLFTTALTIAVALLLYDQLDPDRFAFMLRRLEFNDSSVTNRWQVVQNALLLIQERPFFGIGLGQFGAISEVIEVDSEAGRSPHNFYLGIVASIGLLAAGSLFLYVGAQARALWLEMGLLKRQLHLKMQRNHPSPGRSTMWRLLMGEVSQAMFLFQAVSLMFRGSKRVIDWLPVAMMSVTYLYLREQRLKGERGDDEQAEL